MTTPLSHPENTVEYWIHEAARGEDMALCWQNIHRIIVERDAILLAQYVKEIEKLPTVNGLIHKEQAVEALYTLQENDRI